MRADVADQLGPVDPPGELCLNVIAALKKSQYFSGPELKKTAARADGKAKVVEFTIVAAVNYTPSVQVASAGAEAAPEGKR